MSPALAPNPPPTIPVSALRAGDRIRLDGEWVDVTAIAADRTISFLVPGHGERTIRFVLDVAVPVARAFHLTAN